MFTCHTGDHHVDTDGGQCACVYGSGKSTTNHVTIKGQIIRNMQETVCAEGGVKERGESEYGKGMEAQYQCD